MQAPSPAPLVGRAAEREALARALQALAGGRGGIVVVSGEPGIGKSRLLAELTAAAASEACAVLAGRAAEFESDVPFAMLEEALGGHPIAVRDDRGSPPGAAPAPADRHRIHRSLREELERLADARPLVVCLDDVQWADPASADALAALVRRPPAAPVLLALAARTGGFPRS